MKKKLLMNEAEMNSGVRFMAKEVIRMVPDLSTAALVGIQKRGVILASRLAGVLKKLTRKDLLMGILDITLYRDDTNAIAHQPLVRETDIPFDITGRSIILVDDVLFTGRTVRAALDELIDFGRPESIKLAVLIDRGGRELPIQPDICFKKISLKKNGAVSVFVREIDEEEGVFIHEAGVKGGRSDEAQA